MPLIYNVDVTINKPIDEVITLFDNPENDKKWMQGLEKIEQLEGNGNEEGAKRKLHFNLPGRKITMSEEVVKKNLPDNYTTHYSVKNVENTVISSFQALGEGQTKFTTHNEFEFGGFMKVAAKLMKGQFVKTSQKYLDDFKNFVEKK